MGDAFPVPFILSCYGSWGAGGKLGGYRKNREFKIRRLRTTTAVKHATAHDQNHVTVYFSRVVLRLR